MNTGPSGAVPQCRPSRRSIASALATPFSVRKKIPCGWTCWIKSRVKQIEPGRGGPGGDLHAEPLGVAIDDQAAQAVGLAEDQPCGPIGRVVAQLAAKVDGPLHPPLPERLVQGLGRRPGIEPDTNSAGAVVDAPGDELSVVGHQVDDVAVGRLAFDVIDRAIQHPRMPAIKRPGLAGLEDRPRLGKAGRILDAGKRFRCGVHSLIVATVGAATHRPARNKLAKSAVKAVARMPVMPARASRNAARHSAHQAPSIRVG